MAQKSLKKRERKNGSKQTRKLLNPMRMRCAGKSDPYCKLRVGRKKKLSKVKSKTLNPRWNETFSFSQVKGKPLRILRYA
jgi:Ca2+-dependent lipid-binding protein